ncbi:hypothetical protein BDZ91DRAFT_667258, partial [Kalaharituber pfeilii]
SSMDSDLEAFSHYPADGSFAALPCQTAAKTNYLNQRFCWPDSRGSGWSRPVQVVSVQCRSRPVGFIDCRPNMML